MSNNEVLQILAQHQKKWELIANKLLFSNSELKAIDIVQEMYIKVFDDLTNNVIEAENLIINNKPHFGIIKKIIRRIIIKESKINNNYFSLDDLKTEPADLETEEENLDDKIDEVLKDIYWFDRKLFNLYRKEFHTIRALSKATKISHVIVHKSISKCKKLLAKRVKL